MRSQFQCRQHGTPTSIILRPRGELVVRVEHKFQNLVAVALPDAVAHADADATANKSGADAEAAATATVCDPFRDRFAIAEFGLFVRRAEFGHGLVKRVIPNAAVPINRLGRLAADYERGHQSHNGEL